MAKFQVFCTICGLILQVGSQFCGPPKTNIFGSSYVQTNDILKVPVWIARVKPGIWRSECRFLYANDKTKTTEFSELNDFLRLPNNQKTLTELKPKYVLFSPLIYCAKIDENKVYNKGIRWRIIEKPLIGENVYQIQNYDTEQFLLSRGKERGKDSSKFVWDNLRFIFTENQSKNKTSATIEKSSLWRICSPDNNDWYIRNYETDEDLFLG